LALSDAVLEFRQLANLPVGRLAVREVGADGALGLGEFFQMALKDDLAGLADAPGRLEIGFVDGPLKRFMVVSANRVDA
jgi:hypothetical protein